MQKADPLSTFNVEIVHPKARMGLRREASMRVLLGKRIVTQKVVSEGVLPGRQRAMSSPAVFNTEYVNTPSTLSLLADRPTPSDVVPPEDVVLEAKADHANV